MNTIMKALLDSKAAIVFWLPVILAALISLAINARSMWQLVQQANPFDPWESAITTEAFRISQGDRVYVSSVHEFAADGRATHMYGPLPGLVLAGLFQMVEPDVRVARGMSLASALGCVVLLLSIALRGRPWPWWLSGFALLMTANNYAGGYFVYGKPDLPAIFLALLGVWMHAHALRLRSGWRTLFAAGLFVAAFFSKQNMAALAIAVPGAYLINALLRNERWDMRGTVVAVAPAMVVAATVLLLRERLPLIYGYLILIAAGCPIRLVDCWNYMKIVITSGPFIAAALAWLGLLWRSVLKPQRNDVLAAVTWACGLAISIASAAKQGGGHNSLMSGMLLSGFALLYALNRCAPRPMPGNPKALIVSVSLAAMVLALTWPQTYYGVPRFPDRSKDFWQAVEQVRGLIGTVISPEDPVLLIHAGREPGVNIYLEADRTIVSRPAVINQVIQRLLDQQAASHAASLELQKVYTFADYETMFAKAEHVVEFKPGFYAADYNLLNTDVLVAFGFAKNWENGSYAIWTHRN